MADHSLSVIVPVFNSAVTLPLLIDALAPVLRRCADRFEVILVNDGSSDGSWQAICELASQHGWIRGIDLQRNFGQHNALLCGILAARCDRIVTLDDDLQHPAAEIHRLLEKLEEGHDLVYGMAETPRNGWWRNLTSAWFKRLFLGNPISSFRAFRADLRDSWNAAGTNVAIDCLLSWSTDRVGLVPVAHRSRQHGRSQYTLARLVNLGWTMLANSGTLPLKTVSWLGVVLLIMGLAAGVWALTGGTGTFLLAALVLSLAGINFLATAMLAAFVLRALPGRWSRPAFAIRARTGPTPEGRVAC